MHSDAIAAFPSRPGRGFRDGGLTRHTGSLHCTARVVGKGNHLSPLSPTRGELGGGGGTVAVAATSERDPAFGAKPPNPPRARPGDVLRRGGLGEFGTKPGQVLACTANPSVGQTLQPSAPFDCVDPGACRFGPRNQ